ncbi:MAG TPA: TonB-dependent receptor, partial [Polyangiales bacterium]|nr:TonB-dependent receptor [Polyangiales bacterium]
MSSAQVPDAGPPAAPSEPAPAEPPPEEAAQAPEAPPAEAPLAPAPEVADAGTPLAEVDAAVPEEVMVAPPAEGDGEIVVTAQRYEQDVQKTPVAVNAFSQRAMEARGVTNLQDVGKFTPNLQLQSTNRPAGGGSAYAAYIRGIGTGDFQFPTDPGVGLYIDDVYMARTMGGLISTDADIERIEVIKGPQGTLFGRNTIGGAINIVTSKPRVTGPATGSALVRVGQYGRADLALSANGPLLDGVIGGKLAVASLNSAGYGERVLDGEKTNDEERFVVRGGVLFRLSSDVDIRVDADYSNQDQSPPAGEMLAFKPGDPMGPTALKIMKYNMFAAPALNPGLGLAPNSVFGDAWVSPGGHKTYALQPMYDRYDIGGVTGRVTWNASDAFNLKSITSARFVSSDVAVDGDQTPYPVQSTHTELDDSAYSQEFQLSGDVIDERLRWLVGLYVFRESGDSSVDTQSYHGLFENEPMPIPMDAGDTLQNISLTATSYAAFTQETFKIVDGLAITAGARINFDHKDYDYRSDFTQRMAPQVPQTHAEESWVSFTPKFGIEYSPIEPVLVYASYSQGFKSGGFSQSNSMMNPAPVYDPERATAYEVGVKTHWFEGRKLTANVAAFYTDYRDIQLTVQSVDPVTNANVRSTKNAGRSFIKGFEADIAGSPIRGLVLNGGMGFTDAKFDELTTDAEMTGFREGDPLPQIPDWTFNGGVQYGFPLGNLGELTLRGDLTFKGEQMLTVIDRSSFQDPYTLYSARVSFVPASMEELEVSLYGINLSDERYYVYHATLAPTGQEVAIAGAPLTIYGSVK